MRLGALGMAPATFLELTFPEMLADMKRHSVNIWLQRRLTRPHLIDEVTRRRVESTLCLPVGMLTDGVPLGAIALVPVPAEYMPEPGHTSPGDGDVATGAPFADTFGRLTSTFGLLPAAEGLLAPLTPPALPIAG